MADNKDKLTLLEFATLEQHADALAFGLLGTNRGFKNLVSMFLDDPEAPELWHLHGSPLSDTPPQLHWNRKTEEEWIEAVIGVTTRALPGLVKSVGELLNEITKS